MYYAEIVRAVDRLKRRYHETDPIKLCAAMGIILIPQSLGIAQDAIKGFYLESKRRLLSRFPANTNITGRSRR